MKNIVKLQKIDWWDNEIMHKEQYNEDSLKAYCHYPLILAKQEFEHSQKEIYRITTINLAVATNENLKIVEYVHKNIYEMTLGEFLEWWWDMQEVAEDVVSIEKIDD